MSTQTVTAALDLARAEIGYTQTKAGVSKFGKEYGIPSGAWCAMFVSVILAKAGLVRGVDFPWHAWTPNGIAWGKARGRFRTTDPHPGDLVYFMWPGVSTGGRGVPPTCHVGFVEAVNADGSITTIEGNTSGTAAGVQWNGGIVARRIRTSYVVGYVSPNYGGWYAGALGSRVIFPGDRGEDVKGLQVRLNEEGAEPQLDPDGEDGPLTQAALAAYQRAHALEPDSIAGPLTLGSLGITDGIVATPPPPRPVPPAPASPARLAITGQLDYPTILALQVIYGTPQDGTISDTLVVRPGPFGKGRVVGSVGDSALVRAMQAAHGTEEDGCISTPRSGLVFAMQAALGMRYRDGGISAPYSALIAEIQTRINAGTYRKGSR